MTLNDLTLITSFLQKQVIVTGVPSRVLDFYNTDIHLLTLFKVKVNHPLSFPLPSTIYLCVRESFICQSGKHYKCRSTTPLSQTHCLRVASSKQ